MSRCLARVVNKWFHKPEFPGATDHACLFKAKRDGYCFRHHPSDTKRTLECRRVRLTAQLAAVDAELARITPPDSPGNPS